MSATPPGSEFEEALESRKRPRVRVRFRAEFSGRRVQGQGLVENISSTGALIEKSSHLLTTGSEVMLRFSFFPGASPVEISAQVVRETENGFAVRFEKMDPRTRNVLRLAITRAMDLGEDVMSNEKPKEEDGEVDEGY